MSLRDRCRKYIGLLIVKPWLLPFILWLKNKGGFIARDMALGVGVRTPIAKRVLWWLTKFNVVEKKSIGERVYYKVTDIGRKLVECIAEATIVSRKGILLDFGKEYLVVYVKRTRISWYTIPKEIVEKVHSVLVNAPDTTFNVKELSLSTNLPLKLVARALRVLSILGRTRKTSKGYTARRG